MVSATDMGDGFFSLCWNNHRSTFSHVISRLRDKEKYSDVTLACEGRFFRVHKIVLSVCSEYFDAMLDNTPCKHPIIVLRDVHPDDLEALLSYMYDGIVSVSQNDLGRLIKTAEALRIKGLAIPDDPLMTTDDQRQAGVTTIPIITVPRLKEERLSPQSKRKRKDENGENTVITAQTFSNQASTTNDESHVASPKLQECLEGRHRARIEIRRDSELMVNNLKEELAETNLQKAGTATLMGTTYSVVVSDGATHALVPHPGDPNQVVTRFETAHLAPASHQAHAQPLAEAVAEALAGPSGMQTWLSGNELGSASFTTVEAFAPDETEIGHSTTAIGQPVLNTSQTSTVNVVTTGNPVTVVNNTIPVSTSGPIITEVTSVVTTPSNTTTTGGKETNSLKCHYCNRATFRQSSDLKRHIRIHTGEKPFKCTFCPYKASRKDLLHAHCTKMHNSQQ